MENLERKKKVSPAGLRKRSLYIALGFMLVFDSIFFALLNIELLHLNLKELWPVIVINAGLAFLVSDLFIYKKIRAVFLSVCRAFCSGNYFPAFFASCVSYFVCKIYFGFLANSPFCSGNSSYSCLWSSKNKQRGISVYKG